MNKFTPFWIIWTPTGSTPPKVRHSIRGEAVSEAERLARLTPGAEFYVLEAYGCCKKSDVQWTLADGQEEEEIPF